MNTAIGREAARADGDLVIPARYYARVGEVLFRDGVDITQLLEPLGLSLEWLTRPDATLRLSQVDALVRAGLAMTRRSDLGFDLGRVLKLSSHDMVGFGILSSPDVDYALRLAARFFRLIMPAFAMRCRRDTRHLEVRFRPTAAMSPACLFVHLEAIATATHFEVRELLDGELPDYHLYLSYEPPEHARRYAELREARCHFAATAHPEVRLVYPAALARRRPALADEVALRAAEARCNARVRQAIAGGRVSDWTQMILRESGDGMPTLGELAHMLNLSARTLDRHLKREGAGFRELVKAARQDKARTLLRATNTPITQIAHELGYGDAANFTRAFRRDSGWSPSEFRHLASQKFHA